MKRDANHYTDVETLPSYAKATAAIQIPLSAGLVRLANSKIQNLSLTNMHGVSACGLTRNTQEYLLISTCMGIAALCPAKAP